MKTRLYSLPDWRALLENIGWSDAPTRADVEKKVIEELTRGKVSFAEQSPDAPIEKGCRVTLKTESVLPKFNKEKAVITVGAGLYNAAIEAQLCGMTVGGSAQAAIKGETVSFAVLKVEKRVYPPLTDGLVQDLQLDGITTLADYRRCMENKMRTEYATALCERLVEQLIRGTQMDPPAEEDIYRVIDLEYEPLRVRFQLDTMSPEQWKENFNMVHLQKFYAQIYPDIARLFGTTGKESYYESRKEAAVKTIRTCLVLRGVLAGEADPTEDPQAEQKLMQAMTNRLLNIVYGG